MGKKENCELCGSVETKYQTLDGKYICKTCLKKAGFLPGKNVGYILFSMIKKSDERMRIFSETDHVGNMLSIDTVHHLWRSPVNQDGCHDFNEIGEWKIIENTEVSKGGSSRWIGVFQGKGSEICNRLQLQITLHGEKEMFEYLNFVVATINKNSKLYKDAYGLMQQCINELEEMKKVAADLQ